MKWFIYPIDCLEKFVYSLILWWNKFQAREPISTRQISRKMKNNFGRPQQASLGYSCVQVSYKFWITDIVEQIVQKFGRTKERNVETTTWTKLRFSLQKQLLVGFVDRFPTLFPSFCFSLVPNLAVVWPWPWSHYLKILVHKNK